jgi:nucleoid-associated protein YgaU
VPGATVQPHPPDRPNEVGVVVTVAPGDSLWALTRAAVARETGRGPSAVGDDEVAPRWVRVCAANRDRLQSGDVNVLAPGEAVVIPPA